MRRDERTHQHKYLDLKLAQRGHPPVLDIIADALDNDPPASWRAIARHISLLADEDVVDQSLRIWWRRHQAT